MALGHVAIIAAPLTSMMYFRERVHRNNVTAVMCEFMAPYRRLVPDDPLEHSHGNVGVSPRWRYLPGMNKPTQHCEHCTKQPKYVGKSFSDFLRKKKQQYEQGKKATVCIERTVCIGRTGQLYKMRFQSMGGRVRDMASVSFW